MAANIRRHALHAARLNLPAACWPNTTSARLHGDALLADARVRAGSVAEKRVANIALQHTGLRLRSWSVHRLRVRRTLKVTLLREALPCEVGTSRLDGNSSASNRKSFAGVCGAAGGQDR